MRKLSGVRWQRRAMALAVAVLVTFPASFNSVAAQSTDRDRPTKLTSNEVRGGPVDDTVEYYYSFLAGPGQVTVTVDNKASRSAAAPGAYVELFDSRARKLLNVFVIVGFGNSDRKVEGATLGSRQPVVMKLKLERGVERYMVRVEGAVQLGQAEPSGGISPPVRGKLRVEMQDGSVQEIDLSRVRRITIEP